MTAAPIRRTPLAGVLRALAAAAMAVVSGCGGSSSTPPGTIIVTLSDTSGDFASYRAVLSGFSLVNSSNSTIAPLAIPETVDLAALTDVAEVLQAPAVPSGTYKSASITFNYTIGGVWLSLNGKPVEATLVDPSGNTVTTTTVTVTFDPSHPLTVTSGKSTHLAIDLDLAASHSIDTSVSPPKVTLRPYPVITPLPPPTTRTRVRGALVVGQPAASNYIINVRPLIDLVSNLGAVQVSTDAQTYFNLNGTVLSGAAGLSALATLPQGTLVAAFGTIGDLSGVTPGFHATEVYAGSSLSSAFADYLTGVVGARSGDTLTLHGASFVSRVGLPSYYATSTVTISSTTAVTQDGKVVSGLNAQSISVGQELQVAGQGATDALGVLTSLDATAGVVRLAPTRLWGKLNSATPPSASLDVITLANFAAAGFDFTGTGSAGHNANPATYVVNIGSLDASSSLLQVDGTVTAFGSAPPDFTAATITAGKATEQRLVVEWINGGASAPFTSVSANGLVVDLANTHLGSIHDIFTGPVPLDLTDKTQVPASPLITTTGADQSRLQLAIGKSTLTSGISVTSDPAKFSSAVQTAFKGGAFIYRLVAVGQYNIASNTFVASQISIALE